jgi:hypothetical protein
MDGETLFHGLRSGEGWITTQDLTYEEADNLIQRHMHGAARDRTYWLDEEGDHLVAAFFDRNQPRSNNYPGNNAFPKDGMWGTMRGEHSDKRKEYPNR